MPALLRLLHFLAISSLLLTTFAPVTGALSIDNTHIHLARHHDISLKKRDTQRRCKPRPSSTLPTSVNHPTSTQNSTGVQNNNPAPSPSPSVTHSTNSGTTTTTSNNGNTLPKIGIAYPISDYTPLQYFKTPKVGPFYNWSPYCPPEAKALGYICCPMLWGYKQISDFENLVKPGYAHYALGMNEPNEPSQSNMSPGAAVSMWKQYLDPLADQGYTLVSPACTNGPSGISWYKSFFEECTGCRVHALGVHFYGTNATQMIDYLIELHDTFNMPIWVTEFACNDFSYQTTCTNPFGFLKEAKNFMDNTAWVETYFAFGVMFNMYNVNPVDQLLGSNGQPTALGWEYIN